MRRSIVPFREACLSAFLMLLASPGLAQDPASPWFNRLLLGMEVGPTGAQGGTDHADTDYAARFDGREIVRRCAEAGSQYVVIWARDGEYAYYDSKLVPKCPGLGERDVLRETVEAARPLGLPVIAYCVIQQGGKFLTEHPEMAMRGADGQIIPGRFCLNSPYLETMKGLVAEQLAYGIDGFHLDMVDQGFGPPYGCWCDHCKKRFESEYGRRLPAGATWDDDWQLMLAFRYDTSARFEKALMDHVKAINPRATVDFNYHGNPPFSFEVGQRPVQHAAVGDFNTGETGAWGFDALSTSLHAEFYAAATPGKRFQVAMQRGVRMYHDQTTRPLTDMQWELYTLLAHNAFVTMVDKTGYDGSLDPVAYGRIGQLFHEALGVREHFGQPIVRRAALYYSHHARDWYGREQPQTYQQPFYGAHKALVYEQIPCGVVLDENGSPENLSRCPVVILPDVAILTEPEVVALTNYVESGGNLIVTGLTGTLGPRGESLGRSALSDLIGANWKATLPSQDNHVRLPAPDDPVMRTLSTGIPPDWTFLVEGPAVVYEPTTARAIGTLWKPHRTLRQQRGEEGTGSPMSADAPVGPAILLNRNGRGQVLTFAASPAAATASEHPVAEARFLLRNAIDLLDPTPPVRIDAPTTVEAVVTDDPATRTLRVHLLAYEAPQATVPARNRPFVLPTLLDDPPLYRVRITLRDPFLKVAAAHPSTALKTEGLTVEATVEGVHEVLVFSY